MNDDRTHGTPARGARIALASLAGLGIIGALAGCSTSSTEAEGTPATDGGTSASATPAPEASADAGSDGAAGGTSAAGAYTDGTYEAEGDYRSPGGNETIAVSITVKDDVVTAVTVTPEATSGNAKEYQTRFAGGIADEVVGKELSTLSVDKVAGSSLTGDGFNAAVDEIRADAAA